jgi:hypothetical protein
VREAALVAPAEGSPGTDFVRALLASDRALLEARLSDEAVFNSPIRRYDQRAQVVHLLCLIGTVLPGAGVVRTWSGPEGAATVIAADIDGMQLDATVEELHDDAGRVREVTLMLRPHAQMMATIKRMAAAVERKPPAG